MDENPFTLFLILILLVVGFDPQAEEKLQFTRDFMDRLKTSTANIQASVQSIMAAEEEFKATMLNKKPKMKI